MNNILILNFGTSKDILLSGHTISGYHTQSPHSQITLITYKENESVAKTLKNVQEVVTIDRELIQKITNSPLYSDAFAYNAFTKSVQAIFEEKWDHIINFSNDQFSSYLISAIESERKIGTQIDSNGTARNIEAWSLYQNYVLPKMKRYPISISSIRNNMCGVQSNRSENKINIDSEFLFIANQNFSRIRHLNNKTSKYVIGINLEIGYDGYSLEEKSIKDLLEVFEESQDFKPVLLTSGKGYQKEIVNRLNKDFNNSLISINVDSAALSSVITNLDMIISSSNDQLLMADLLGIRSIELRDIESNVLSTNSQNEKNYTILQVNSQTMSSDIILAVNEVFQSELPITSLSSANPTYLTVNDQNGVFMTQIRGNLDIQSELNYHLQRELHYNLLGAPQNTALLSYITEQTNPEDLSTFNKRNKVDILEATKLLLATLKSIKNATNSKAGLQSFIETLDNLMAAGNTDSITGSLIRFFEGVVENITSQNAEQNLKEIEQGLFDLKSNINTFSSVIDQLIKTETKSETRSEKPSVQL